MPGDFNTVDYKSEISKKFAHLWKLVGNTPMIEILYQTHGKISSIYAKCEHYNLTGSIKDRMALYILQTAYRAGTIKPFSRIVEATSGNTGIAFAAIGRALGHEVIILMPDWLSRERTDIIKSLGAKIISVSKAQGGFIGCIQVAEAMAKDVPDIFLPRQFENQGNVEAHAQTTALEIWAQLERANLRPDAFVAGVGTGGTVMGMSTYLKRKNNNIKIYPLEPLESPTLSVGYKIGTHRIQGISDDFIPAILDLKSLDTVIPVSDGDAILMAQKMASTLGLAVGISSGANILGAMKVKAMLGDDAVVVTVLPDSNKKYLSTDLMRPEPVKKDHLAPTIELLDYTPLERAFDS